MTVTAVHTRVLLTPAITDRLAAVRAEIADWEPAPMPPAWTPHPTRTFAPHRPAPVAVERPKRPWFRS